LIKENAFREDLYYRLKVVDLDLPPLRERKNDNSGICWIFHQRIEPAFRIERDRYDPCCNGNFEKILLAGNIRELRNTIERAMLFCDGEKIDVADLPLDFVEKWHNYAI
jgi:DNA-binding NtrC family response regulator